MPNPNNKIPWLAIVTIAVLAFAGGIGLSHVQSRSGEAGAIDGLLWPDPVRLKTLQLVDQTGSVLTQADLAGHWSLVFFGFTHCPDVCPVTLEMMARAHAELKSHGHYGERGQIVFVSVDPARDTPTALADYVKYFSPELIGVTGSEAQLTALTRQLGVLFMRVEQGGQGDQGENNYSIDHSAGIFFIDPELRLVSVLTPPHTAAAIVQRYDAVSAFIEAQ